MEHTIILYYKYIAIKNPRELVESEREICEKLGLRGRIIIAEEGINGTLEGEAQAMEKYCANLKSDPRFSDIQFKTSVGTGNAFPRLNVKVRSEIVTLGVPGNTHAEFTRGTYLPPDRLHEWYEKGEDFVVIDMRNRYESEVGRFENSIAVPIKNFRELPRVIEKLASLKNRKVVTVCTGGVRCEKASGYLVEQGFKDVYQLHGGIHTYLEKYPEGKFQGGLYVFDGRIVMKVAPEEKRKIIGKCARCTQPSEDYTNCANTECHVHFICCKNCRRSEGEFCSEECKEKQWSIV